MARRERHPVVADALAIYLADHFAGATFGLELVRRCRAKNDGTPFAAPLSELVREVEADRRTLLKLMRRLGAEPSLVKTAVGWTLEKARRLKPNGDLFAYTPLSRVAELEILQTGIAGKRALWTALDAHFSERDRAEGLDFGALAERAARQIEVVERLRLEAAAIAFRAS
jgi:hypothetical protein